MTSTLTEYDTVFDVRRFPPGHAIQAGEGIEKRARHMGYDDLIRLVTAVKGAAMHYIERRARRSIQNLARGDGRTRVIDSRIDSNWGQIHDVLKREVATYGDTEGGALAAELMGVLFPRGLAGTTQLPYEEQVALNEYQVALVREKHPDAPAELGIERPLRRIEALLPEYRASLDVVEQVSAIEVGEAYADMQVKLLRVVGWIMVMVEDDTRRAELMAPVRDQEKRLAAAYAARRRGQSAPADVALDELDLDPEARAALDEMAAAEAALQAEADGQAEAEAAADAEGEADAEGDRPLRPLGLPG